MPTLALVNGKGGVGKSVTALNTGVSLSRMAYEVVAVDVDLDMGDLGRYAGVVGDGGIEGVLAGDQDLTEALVEGPGGLSVLSGQRSVDGDQAASASDLPGLFRQLESEFEVVLVDTPPGLRDELPVSVGNADWSLVVTTPGEPSLTNARQTAELVEKAGGSVLGVVVSRAGEGTDLDAIEARVGAPVVGVLPEDPAFEQSAVVTDASTGDTPAQEYEELARVLAKCLRADDPVGLVETLDTPSLSGDESVADDIEDATQTDAEAGADATTDADDESDDEDDSAGGALGGGTRMGSARDADYHRELVEEAMDKTDDES
ncbi:hypothetical protein BRC92_13050 [Halobacteriales archaeon QS_4_69_31]|nr:MAG: hypothetical protein BRC92_13050 [Halobacteriales archaeon QS_4_69_31]